MHEGDVEVAGVADLPAAETTEGDDRHRHLRIDGLQGALEAGLGQAGEVGADLLHVRVAEHVTSGDAQEVALLPPLEGSLLLVAILTPRDDTVGTRHEVGPRPAFASGSGAGAVR